MRGLLLILMALTLQGCQRPSSRPLMIDNRDVADGIRAAEKVSVYRLVTNHEYRPEISDYEIEEGPIALSSAQRDQLRDRFLSAHDFPRPPVSCLPDYRIQLHFESGLHSVDILLCLECRLMALYHDGKAVTVTNFEPIASQLTTLAQDLFPNDVDVQAIQIRR